MRIHNTFSQNVPGKFDLSNVLGDPVSMSTISTAIIAWILAFGGSIVTDIKGGFPNYAWWALAHMFFFIVGIIYVVGTKTEANHQLSIVGHAAASLVFVTSAVNALIYQSLAAPEAASAGFILLSMIDIIWMSYFGYTSVSPQAPHKYPAHLQPTEEPHNHTFGPSEAPIELNYNQIAISEYEYTANPDDPNEVSFGKGERLEVADSTGRWWQVRRANKQTGIAPSNYLILQEDVKY